MTEVVNSEFTVFNALQLFVFTQGASRPETELSFIEKDVQEERLEDPPAPEMEGNSDVCFFGGERAASKPTGEYDKEKLRVSHETVFSLQCIIVCKNSRKARHGSRKSL